MKNTLAVIPNERILSRIFLVRGKKVILDIDLAELYQVSTMRLNEQVKRNSKRFPPDFMFQLTKEEYENLISQIAISSWGGSRKRPKVFTEQGVAMLSSVLNSDRAIQVNIQIIRTFTRLREILSQNKALANKIEKMERKYDKHISHIFKLIKKLTAEEERPKEPIGFRV